jgi:uroporphyrinogen decarboxylase
MQPIRRYSGLLDASIIFSDILVIPQALGLVVEMNPAPSFPDPLNSPDDVKRLKEHVDVDKELGYVYEAVTQTRHALKGEVPLIGFVGAPWTLMAYMIEGGGSKLLEKSKKWLFKYPEESKALLNRIADVCADHLVGQIKAGAQVRSILNFRLRKLTKSPTHRRFKSLILGPGNFHPRTLPHSPSLLSYTSPLASARNSPSSASPPSP